MSTIFILRISILTTMFKDESFKALNTRATYLHLIAERLTVGEKERLKLKNAF